MDLKEIRKKSLSIASDLGYETNPNLPLLDEDLTLRPVDEIIRRSLALFATVAGSYGFDKKKATTWLEREKAIIELASSEKEFLAGGIGDASFFQSQVEALQVFAWSLGIIKNLEFDQVCDNNLIKLFPDIKNDGDSNAFNSKSKLRDVKELVFACDLAYCLHWAVIQAETEGKRLLNNDISTHVIVERRRALEWLLSKGDWDDLSLDT